MFTRRIGGEKEMVDLKRLKSDQQTLMPYKYLSPNEGVFVETNRLNLADDN